MSCRCGNPAVTTCPRCRADVCRLCLRETVCIACRALEAPPAAPSGSFRRGRRVRKHVILAPLVVVAAVGIMSAVAAPILSDARRGRAERRAEDALRDLVAAEEAWHHKRKAYAKLEELIGAGLYRPREVPGYEIRVDLAKDGRAFWVRAVPRTHGLRGLVLDARGGEPIVEGAY